MWRDLLAVWCNPRRADAPEGAPGPLAEFLRAGGAMALWNQNRFVTPVDKDGWSVFYVESQGVCTWAYRTGDPDEDPEVHVREDGDYVPVGCRLDAFLSAAALVEAVFGAPQLWSGECRSAEVDGVLELPRADLPHLGWPPETAARYYRGRDLLAFTDDASGYSWAYVGARSEQALAAVERRFAEL